MSRGRVFQRGNRWWVAYYISGREYRESAGTTRQEAERVLRTRLSGEPAPVQLTVNDLLDLVVEDYRINRRKSLKTTTDHMKRPRERLGHLRAEQVTSQVLKTYRDQRLREGLAPATINREFAAVRRGFRLAENLACPRFPMLVERNARQGFFEPGDLARLETYLPDYLRPLVRFAYYTGCRRGEMLSLQWQNVDLSERLIRLTPDMAKSGRGRVLALEGGLWGVIDRQSKLRPAGCPWVFHREGERIKPFDKTWRKACQDAGLIGKLFHDLRRTAVRNMVRAGVPERVAMEISGHRTRSVFDRYNIVNEQDIRQAMRRVTGEE